MQNPTSRIPIDFCQYVQSRESALQAHMVGGIPDYAFGMDFSLRKRLRAIPLLYKLCLSYAAYIVPRMKKELEAECICVGPKQYPEIYKITQECARTLGIGIPTVYIKPDLANINAGAFATDDVSPLIVINSALVERFTLDELRFVIGHECGHIHNLHSVYSIAADLLVSGGMTAGAMGGLPNGLLALMNLSTTMALKTWARAGEVTCDRAGIICCVEYDTALSSFEKMMTGGMMNNSTRANMDELKKQYESIRKAPTKLLELTFSHPVVIRRILAAKEFMNSDAYYQWHPEKKTAGMTMTSHDELDRLCNEYISIVGTNTSRKGGM